TRRATTGGRGSRASEAPRHRAAGACRAAPREPHDAETPARVPRRWGPAGRPGPLAAPGGSRRPETEPGSERGGCAARRGREADRREDARLALLRSDVLTPPGSAAPPGQVRHQVLALLQARRCASTLPFAASDTQRPLSATPAPRWPGWSS